MIARLLKSLSALFGGQVLTRFGSFILVPAYLTYWSPAVYGEWLVLFSLAGYLGTLDLGTHLAAVNRLTKCYATGDLLEYRIYQHSAWVFYLGILGIGGCLIALVSWIFPTHAWLNLTVTSEPTAKIIILILSIYVLAGLPLRLLCSVYQTTGNLARSQWISNFQQLATITLTMAALFLGGTMVIIALAQIGALLLTGAYVIFDVKRKFPELLPGVSLARLAIIKEQLKPSSLFALLTFSNALMYQGTILFVSSLLGGLAVAVFSISRTLSLLVRQLVDAISISLWPELTRNEGLGDLGKLRSLHRLLVASSTSLCVAAAAFLFFEGGAIIRFWTADRIEPDIWLLRLLLVWMVFEAPWLASSAIGASSNRHKTFAWAYFASVVLGLGIMRVLIPRFGLWSAPLGFLFGEALVCYHFVIRDSCRMLSEDYRRFALRLWFGLASIALLTLSLGWTTTVIFRENALPRWILIAFSTLMASALGGWYLLLESSDRKLVLERLRPFLKIVRARLFPHRVHVTSESDVLTARVKSK